MFRVFMCLSIFSASAFAQSTFQLPTQSQQISLRGHVSAAPGTRLDNLLVEVQSAGSDGMSQNIPVSRSGYFNFDAIAGQTYFLRVLDGAGNVIAQEIVTANAMAGIEINLPESRAAEPVNGTVSLYELQHKVPSKAFKEGRLADKCAAKHDMQGYIEHAQNAVAIDPDWTVARRNLGVGYLQLGENDKAVEQFQEALKRDPRSVRALAALSAAYLQMNKLPEAESAGRRAVDVDSTNQPSCYYLGISLALQHKADRQALQLLERVSNQFPKARIAAAEILSRLGMKEAVKGELQQYLSTGDTQARSQVKSWLSSVQ